MNDIANTILRPFALVVTDRRWAAPLSAAALGFGIFAGVAIGPSATGTLAGTAQILEIPSGGEDGTPGEGEAGSGGGGGGGIGLATGPSSGGGGALGALPAPIPLAPAPSPPPPAGERAQSPAPPAKEEPAEEAELKGVVAHANPAAGSYALAIEGGELVPVHARKLPAPGERLSVVARRLANGTFAEAEKPRRSGRASQTSFRGVVTYVDANPAAPAYTVSGRGASILVRVEPDPAGAVPGLAPVGSHVTVTAAIEAGLRQRRIEIEEGEPSAYLDLAGVVTELLPDSAQLLLSADGAGESEADLTLAVPAEIDTSGLEIGDSYLATATVEPDGSLSLTGIASDEHTKGADDPAGAQGDLKRQP